MKRLIIILCLAILGHITTAQNVSDLESQLSNATETNERVAILTKIIRANTKKGNLSKAINAGRKVEKEIKQNKTSNATRANAYWAIAAAYHKDTNYGKATNYYNKAQLYMVLTDSQRATMQIFHDMAKAESAMDKNAEAAEHFRSSLKISEHLKDYQMSTQNYMALSEIYGKMRKYRDAFEYFKKVAEIQAKTAKQEELQRMELIQYKADLIRIEKEKKDLALRNKELELNKAKKTQSRLKQEVNVKNEAIQELNHTSKLQSDSIKQKEKEVEEKQKLVELERKTVKMQQRFIYMISGGAAIILIFLIISIRLFLLTKKKNHQLKAQNIQIIKQKNDIQKKKDEIQQKNDALQLAYEEIEQLNQNLLQKIDMINKSFNYAKRIQRALLPSKEEAQELLKRHFILWRPRDVVSGDFYWFAKIKNRTIVVAADCTGHGVPGAFMSALGVAFLNDVVREQQIVDPEQILEALRTEVIKALGQTKTSKAKDGMDMACLSISHTDRKVYYSGAHNPLYLVRGGELITYKADRMPVAIHAKMRPFKAHEIETRPGDTFYIFSDGFTDQFGGEYKLKFGTGQFKKMILDMRHKSMLDQNDIAEKTLDQWKIDTDQLDDILLMGIKL